VHARTFEAGKLLKTKVNGNGASTQPVILLKRPGLFELFSKGRDVYENAGDSHHGASRPAGDLLKATMLLKMQGLCGFCLPLVHVGI
jgi:hypothetical protein